MAFIQATVLPTLEKKQVTFQKTVSVIMVHKGVTQKVAEECLNAVIAVGIIKRDSEGNLLKGNGGAIKA